LHTTNGILIGAGSAIVGAAAHTTAGAVSHVTDGALVGPGSTISGTALWYLSGVYGDPQLQKTVIDSRTRIGNNPVGKPRRIG
jgi:hypothetical protein